MANLRGEYARGLEYTREAEGLARGARALDSPEESTSDLAPGGRLVVALGLQVRTLDPALAVMNEEIEVARQRLREPDRRRRARQPRALARRALGGAGRRRAFEFELRADVLFHDGRSLTARAVKECFERALRDPSARRLAAFASLAGLERARRATARSRACACSASGVPRIRTRAAPLGLSRAPDGAPVHARPRRRVTRVGRHRAVRAASRRAARRGARAGGPTRTTGTGRPLLAELEFRMDVSSADAVEGLRCGELDSCSAWRPRIPRTSSPRAASARARRACRGARPTSCLFNELGPNAADPILREVPAGALRVDELVWTHLGAAAGRPSRLPPARHPRARSRRRRSQLTLEEARARLAEAGCGLPLELTAAVNPVYPSGLPPPLWDAVQSEWAELGVRVEVVTASMADFQRAWTENETIDLLVGRWIADYNDPDDFTTWPSTASTASRGAGSHRARPTS